MSVPQSAFKQFLSTAFDTVEWLRNNHLPLKNSRMLLRDDMRNAISHSSENVNVPQSEQWVVLVSLARNCHPLRLDYSL